MNPTNVSSGDETRRKKTLKNKHDEIKIDVKGLALGKEAKRTHITNKTSANGEGSRIEKHYTNPVLAKRSTPT